MLKDTQYAGQPMQKVNNILFTLVPILNVCATAGLKAILPHAPLSGTLSIALSTLSPS